VNVTWVRLLIIFCVLLTYQSTYSQLLFFPEDSAKFSLKQADSVFIFTKNLAVTAKGQFLTKIRYQSNAIAGENVPPTIRLREPEGAIIYQSNLPKREIPVIFGRSNLKMTLKQLFRDYLTGLNYFKGNSAKGGIQINVWEKSGQIPPLLIFLKNGRLLGNLKLLDSRSSKNYSLVNNSNLPGIIDKIAGVWIYPPQIGNHQLTAKIIRLLQTGPLLVEFWDGLGWQYFEKAYLGLKEFGKQVQVRMSHSLFPPETSGNYQAIIGAGLTEIAKKMYIMGVCLRTGDAFGAYTAFVFVVLTHESTERPLINFHHQTRVDTADQQKQQLAWLSTGASTYL